MDRPPTPTPSPVAELVAPLVAPVVEPANFDSLLPPSHTIAPVAQKGFVPFSGKGRRLDGK
jgi:hypothetical protein